MNPTRVFAFATLAALAGCSSPSGESVSSTSAAVTISTNFQELKPVGTKLVLDVGAGPINANTLVYWLSSSGQEYTWDSEENEPGTAVAGAPAATAIDYGYYTDLWTIRGGQVYGGSSGALIPGPTPATDIGVSNDGLTAYMIGPQDQIYRWQGTGVTPAWKPMAGQFGTRIDAANDGSAWVVNSVGAIWHISGEPTAPVATEYSGSGTAHDITVGADNTVFFSGYIAFGDVDRPIYYFNIGAGIGITSMPGALGIVVSAISASSLTVGNTEGQVWTTAKYVANP